LILIYSAPPPKPKVEIAPMRTAAVAAADDMIIIL